MPLVSLRSLASLVRSACWTLRDKTQLPRSKKQQFSVALWHIEGGFYYSIIQIIWLNYINYILMIFHWIPKLYHHFIILLVLLVILPQIRWVRSPFPLSFSVCPLSGDRLLCKAKTSSPWCDPITAMRAMRREWSWLNHVCKHLQTCIYTVYIYNMHITYI